MSAPERKQPIRRELTRDWLTGRREMSLETFFNKGNQLEQVLKRAEKSRDAADKVCRPAEKK